MKWKRYCVQRKKRKVRNKIHLDTRHLEGNNVSTISLFPYLHSASKGMQNRGKQPENLLGKYLAID